MLIDDDDIKVEYFLRHRHFLHSYMLSKKLYLDIIFLLDQLFEAKHINRHRIMRE
jgi:hypothetical protein